MAASIRSDPNIKGINLPLHDNVFRESRLSQFVDDTQLFCKTENYLSYMFKCLILYEKASGAKLNKAKTTGLLIGSLKNKFPTFKDIKWTKSSVKTLGVYHGYNIDEDALWLNKIDQIKTSLNVWKRRNVTFQGKTLIIKSYIVSSILFEMEARGIPQKHVNTLDC